MDKTIASPQTLSVESVPSPHTEVISGALIAPMAPGAEMAYGVFRADGSFCEPSRTLMSANRFSGRCEFLAPETYLPGTHLFAGIGRHHFGHFLLECVSRLWPLQEGPAYDGIVIVPKQGIDVEAVFQRRFRAFLDLLTGGLPVYLVAQPLEVQTLVLPTQGIGHLRWSTGTECFRHFVRSRIADKVAPDGPDRLYVSRTQLKRAEQMVDHEARIEEVMKRAGYEIFHPQKHSLEVQCARYMAARHIVGADGSAFHLAPFAMQSRTKVGLIQRRDRPEIVAALVSQIRGFCDVDLVTFDALVKGEGKDREPKPQADIDFDLLKRRLKEERFI